MDPPSELNMAAYFKMAATHSKIFPSIAQTTVDLMLEAQNSAYLNDLVYLSRFCFDLSLKFKMAALKNKQIFIIDNCPEFKHFY